MNKVLSKTDSQNGTVRKKYNHIVHTTNPSVPSFASSKRRKVKIGDDRTGALIDNESGEVTGIGGAMFYKWEEVDDEKFVKIYAEGASRCADLSRAAQRIYHYIFKQLYDTPNVDTISIIAQELADSMSYPTFQKGLRELLNKELLYMTPYPSTYFINIHYLFNGNRLAFVKGYYRKGTKPPKLAPSNGEQIELFSD